MATGGDVKTFSRKTKIIFFLCLGWLVWGLAWVVFPLLPAPWPPFYWALPVYGRVVETGTNVPLEGVSVVAHWELRGPWGISGGQLAVMESVTDKEGRFSFSWWRPRLRLSLAGLLSSNAPRLVFFKNGYSWESCSNDSLYPNLNPFPASDCNGTIVHLGRFEGTEEEYAEELGNLNISLSFATHSTENCEWTHIPHMIATLIQEKKRFQEKKIYNHLPSLETFPDQGWCGSREKIFRGYLERVAELGKKMSAFQPLGVEKRWDFR